jgi:hypothetical protein
LRNKSACIFVFCALSWLAMTTRLSTLTLLIFSTFFSATIGMGFQNGLAATDSTAPSVKITDPKFNSAHPPGVIVVKGTVFDNAGGSGLKEVEVKVDSSGTYALATPKASGDWSTWSIA